MIGFSLDDTALLYRLRDHNRRRGLAAELEERAFREEVVEALDHIVRFSCSRKVHYIGDAARLVRQLKSMGARCWDRYADRLDGIRRVTGIEVPSRDPRRNP